MHCHWSDDGERVVFLDSDAFARDVCPRYFRHSKWTSFMSILYMHEFRKVSRSPRNARSTRYEFAHEFFTRDRQDLLNRVQRAQRLRCALASERPASAQKKKRRPPPGEADDESAAARPRVPTARQASMRSARAEKEQARAAQAVSVSPDPRAAKRPRALSEGTVVTVETLASDVGELEDPLDAFFDHSPALFCEEAWDAPPPRPPSPGWLGGGCDAPAAAAAAAAPPPGAWADRPIAASRPELWIGPAVASPF